MKALILTITAGQGHNATAKALAASLEQLGIECRVLDTYYYLNHLLGDIVSKGYLVSVNNKPLYREAYKTLEKRKKNSYKLSATRLTNLPLVHKMKKLIDEFTPDVIICTHIFAGVLIDVILQLRETTAKTIGILTDFTFHPYWEETLRFDYLITPSELLNLKAKKKGFLNHQILPLGIPIDKKFAAEISRESACAQIGLDPKRHIVLLMSGSMGYGHIENTVRILDESDIDLQIIIVCGNNDEAHKKIGQMKLTKPVLNYGFITNVDVLMSAADCIITKPGGLTTSEALAKQLPMIVMNPIPGHEDRNTEFLLNNGAAMSVTPTFPLDEILHHIFDHPERLRIMRESIDLIRKPNSTENFCNFVKSLDKADAVEKLNGRASDEE
ncbi:MAG: glycosyltransferase [Eubacteriales bacterium]